MKANINSCNHGNQTSWNTVYRQLPCSYQNRSKSSASSSCVPVNFSDESNRWPLICVCSSSLICTRSGIRSNNRGSVCRSRGLLRLSSSLKASSSSAWSASIWSRPTTPLHSETNNITLHYITLHYITYNITLWSKPTTGCLLKTHCITLHYITLHYITLHYIMTIKTSCASLTFPLRNSL